MSDHIRIKSLRAVTTVGVSDEERSAPQTVAVSVSITLRSSFRGIDDDISNTINYFDVSQSLRKVAATGQRKLIETLAEDLAAAVIEFEDVCAVTLEVEKFILADCESVSVEITRAREHC